MTFELSTILHLGLIKVPLEGTTKREAIDELCNLLCSTDVIGDPDNFRRTVWDREGQRSTGIGEGLAIPHGKCAGVREITMAIGLPQEPIEFDSIDEQPVDLIFLLLAPECAGADHLKALARVSRLLRDRSTCEKLRGSEDPDALYALLIETATDAAA